MSPKIKNMFENTTTVQSNRHILENVTTVQSNHCTLVRVEYHKAFIFRGL